MTIELLERPLRAAPSPARISSVLELRQYTVQPGQRENLIDLFEREFVDSQQDCGIEVIGIFRDLDAPDRLVWLRGFSDMPTRAHALAEFYGGPIWRAHRTAANATMIDFHDVLLLRPARPHGGFVLPSPTPSAPAAKANAGVILAHIHPLHAGAADAFIEGFERVWLPMLWEASIPLVASLVTEPRANSFPALPVRENESVFVWFSRHRDETHAAQALARIEHAHGRSTALDDALAGAQSAPTLRLRLQPTPRSRLRG